MKSHLAFTSCLIVMLMTTSCISNSTRTLAQLMGPSTVKPASANVIPGELEEAAPVTKTVKNGVASLGGFFGQNPIKPISRSDSSYSGGYFNSERNSANTGFNFPSMIGSNLLVRTTAYCHKETDSLPYGKKNAAGGILQYGSIIRSAAADWSRFPVGTRFMITGEPHEYVIDDYGSALVGTNTIDIYKPTFTAMKDWGVREVPIRILEWGCFHKSREILSGRQHVEWADHVRQMLKDIESRYIRTANRSQSDRINPGA